MFTLTRLKEISIMYKIISSNNLNLNEDIKFNIWNFYKKQIAYDIIKNFIKKNILQCDECSTIRWKKNLNNIMHNYDTIPNFYNVSACDNYSHDICCPIKMICIISCKFKIKCCNCNHNYEYLPNNDYKYNNEDTIGFNIIEGKQIIYSDCPICDNLNIINLIWYN